MKPSALRGNVLCPILLFALVPLLASCAGEKAAGNTYTVRARVQQLPSSQDSGLYLEHEPIDNYVARSGRVEGMDSMTMPFPVGKSVSLEDIQAGDVVEAQLHIDWTSEDSPVEIIALRELPPDTKLNFGEAKPPQS